MINISVEQLNSLTKRFCDGSIIGHNKAVFMLAVSTGEEKIDGYVILPEQMKLIQNMINENMALYEKEYGPITNLSKVEQPIISPLQLNRPPRRKPSEDNMDEF